MGLQNMFAMHERVGEEFSEAELREDIDYFKSRLESLHKQRKSEKRGHAMALVYKTLIRHRQSKLELMLLQGKSERHCANGTLRV